jgi:hypothetical protein
MVAMSSSDEVPTWRYRFVLRDGEAIEFDVRLDPRTLALPANATVDLPEWTRLTHHQCINCPLREDEHPHCPIAANLAGVLDRFARIVSHQAVDVEIAAPSRAYRKQVTVQQALGSLVGIYMVSSGCPVLDKLRPLVATHLPVATLRETSYRAISMYLLAQYFLSRKGREPDWRLEKLPGVYEEIQKVNRGFFKRIISVGVEDAMTNAILQLDSYAEWIQILLSEEGLGEIEALFGAYLEEQERA